MKKIVNTLILVLLTQILTIAQPADSLVIGIWLGEYSGFDPQTQSNITIRRRLIIEEVDKAYSDTLWGQPTQSEEIIFEMEIGNWEINFTKDSIIFTPTVSKRIDISNPDSLVVYQHGIHTKELNEVKDQWQFHDYNMTVDYYLYKEEFIDKPGTPAGETMPVLGENYNYTTSGATSNLDHTMEYSFNWGDGSGSNWNTSDSASHNWSIADTMFVTVTARCQLHTDKYVTSDTLEVIVQEPPAGIIKKNSTSNLYSFKIFQNYSTPVNSSVIISYLIPKYTHVDISVFNIHGQFIKSLVNQYQSTGYYEVFWNGEDENGNFLNSGIYLYTFKTKEYFNINKGIFLK